MSVGVTHPRSFCGESAMTPARLVVSVRPSVAPAMAGRDLLNQRSAPRVPGLLSEDAHRARTRSRLSVGKEQDLIPVPRVSSVRLPKELRAEEAAE
jgi:hypothetical protein